MILDIILMVIKKNDYDSENNDEDQDTQNVMEIKI